MALRFDQEACWLGEFRFDTVGIDDPDANEDRLVEPPSHVVVGGPVHLVRVGQKLEPSADVLGADADVIRDLGESGGYLGSLALDRSDAVARL